MINKRDSLNIINLYRGCKPWQYCPNWQRRFWPSPCPTYGSKWSYSQYWIKKPSKKQVCITFKSTVIRKVSRYFITVFRYIAKSICTTYQGLLQATSILTLWQKLSPHALCMVLDLESVIWRSRKIQTVQNMKYTIWHVSPRKTVESPWEY